ncbi:MAG TPA: twin-arginine translocation signal domain-containing protein [Bryobacteraceae bacterium]|nr:twin-arginine translocation signal domain-containing protein [Bryobacteraceae bacterium]
MSHFSRRQFIQLAGVAAASAATGPSPVTPWKSGVRIHPVSSIPGRHTIHTYFNVSPETVDGRRVLYYTSVTPEGYTGEIRMQERATGKETVLVRNLECEDAHRVACQQWVSNDRRVVFHDLRNGEVVVVTVDVKTLKQRVLAKHRMVSWGTQDGDLVPIYGVHFQPDQYTDVELLNVESGEIRTLVTAKQVRAAYPQQIRELYADHQISTPFGTLSPDQKLIFFKLSTMSPGYKPLPEGHLRWPHAYESDREGLVCFDIEHRKLLFFKRNWGHPSWDSRSTTILNMPNLLIDGRTGQEHPIPNLPKFPGQHLSFSPDGKLFVTDTQLTPFGGAKGEWGIAVCDVRGGDWTMLARFRGDQGATTWRKNHPHPAFSPDGNRIYYNVNSGKYTQLYVAERSQPLQVSRGA